jgi:hypothetical protein
MPWTKSLPSLNSRDIVIVTLLDIVSQPVALKLCMLAGVKRSTAAFSRTFSLYSLHRLALAKIKGTSPGSPSPVRKRYKEKKLATPYYPSVPRCRPPNVEPENVNSRVTDALDASR